MDVLKKTAVTGIASAAMLTQVPAIAHKIPNETWMGVYLGEMKIGYARIFIDKAEFEGKSAFLLETTNVVSISVMGQKVEQEIQASVHMSEDFAPIRQVFDISSGGRNTTISARFHANKIIAEIKSNDSKSSREIAIPEGSKIIADTQFLPSAMKLKVGDSFKFKYFDPLRLILDDVEIEVLRKEEIEIDGEKHECLAVKSHTSLTDTLSWQDEDGNLLKSVASLMGFTMIRESKETAMSLFSDDYAPTEDLAVMTSAQSSIEIPNARKVKYMKARISGLKDEKLIISDHRQKAEILENGDVEYMIFSTHGKPEKTAQLPLDIPDQQRFLKASPYIESDNKEIMEKAAEIVGDEKDAYAAVSKIWAWVYANMTPRGDMGVPRPSVDVLRTMTGVCRDYAALYSALARASGIPTKIVSGLLYHENGFYYHAWAESFVGEWMPVDPTMPVGFVDATHIKLSEGGAVDMFDSVKTAGKLKIEVLEVRE